MGARPEGTPEHIERECVRYTVHTDQSVRPRVSISMGECDGYKRGASPNAGAALVAL